MGPQFKESKSKSRLFNRAKHAEEAQRRESGRSKMVFVLTMDVDDEDIHQTWIKDVTQASLTEADEIEQQQIEEAKRASLAETRQQKYQEQSSQATGQDYGSKKSVRFSTDAQEIMPATMGHKLLKFHENDPFTPSEADHDSAALRSETDKNEVKSKPDASTEERLPPADRHNINGLNSDRPFTSLPFVQWPDEVRQQTLISMLVKDDESIIPYYHQGSVEGNQEETRKPNYDIRILLATVGEPRLYQEALQIFYSQNVWEFRNPRVAQWWLKKLGTKVALLRHINIDLTQGVWGIGSTPLEKLWYMLIVWMKSRVKLDTIKVSFEKWDHALVHHKNEPPTKFFPVAESRLGVWSTLLSFRGLSDTYITPGLFVSYDYAAALARTMMLRENQVDAEAERLERRWRERGYPDAYEEGNSSHNHGYGMT